MKLDVSKITADGVIDKVASRMAPGMAGKAIGEAAKFAKSAVEGVLK